MGGDWRRWNDGMRGIRWKGGNGGGDGRRGKRWRREDEGDGVIYQDQLA